MKRAKAAGERFFRLCRTHTVRPDADTLFNVLNAAHSLNDRLKKATGRDLLDLDEFVALNPLRNLLHHEEELVHEVKAIPATDLPPITTDLLFLCLVPSPLVRKAIDGVSEKHRQRVEAATTRALHWYGSVVNINPCLFNLSVHIYERFEQAHIKLAGDECEEFDAGYRAEEETGQPHFVRGQILCHGASVDEILEKAFREKRK